jgi:hypothetical protein
VSAHSLTNVGNNSSLVLLCTTSVVTGDNYITVTMMTCHIAHMHGSTGVLAWLNLLYLL